jgi:hypothetical protein
MQKTGLKTLFLKLSDSIENEEYQKCRAVVTLAMQWMLLLALFLQLQELLQASA